MADLLQLSDAERAQALPSGKIPVILSRVGWALSYLKQARVVESPRRGIYQLTARGKEVVASRPQRVDGEFLSRFPEFLEFLQRARASTGKDADSDTPSADRAPELPDAASPEEALDAAYGRLRAGLETELLDEDRLGLDVIYVQAKRWESSVGRPEIQKFAGALQGQRARKGIFITTSDFTREADEYAQRIESRIILVNGRRLARLMFDFDVGATPRSTYTVKQLDSDYFEET